MTVIDKTIPEIIIDYRSYCNQVLNEMRSNITLDNEESQIQCMHTFEFFIKKLKDDHGLYITRLEAKFKNEGTFVDFQVEDEPLNNWDPKGLTEFISTHFIYMSRIGSVIDRIVIEYAPLENPLKWYVGLYVTQHPQANAQEQ